VLQYHEDIVNHKVTYDEVKKEMYKCKNPTSTRRRIIDRMCFASHKLFSDLFAIEIYNLSNVFTDSNAEDNDGCEMCGSVKSWCESDEGEAEAD